MNLYRHETDRVPLRDPTPRLVTPDDAEALGCAALLMIGATVMAIVVWWPAARPKERPEPRPIRPTATPSPNSVRLAHFCTFPVAQTPPPAPTS